MKAIGFGDNVADVYLHTRTRYPGGNSVNFAVFAKQLGVSSAYLGVFGNDEIAAFIQEELTKIGIDLSRCVQLEGENGYAQVNLVDGDRVFVGGNGGGISTQYPPILDAADLNYLKEFSLIHSGCYASVEPELPKLRELEALVAFDFSEESKFRTDRYLQSVCPFIDFALFSGGRMTDTEIDGLAKRVSEHGVRHILVTRGSQGALFFSNDAPYVGAVEYVEPVDTMGAGDAFLTALLIHLVRSGWTKSQAPTPEAIQAGLQFAASFSAKTCLIDGAFGHGQQY
ncbi:PfkB family carbohydrate kinase [Brevibacillus choshinensis]|uniref:Fructoselysine 6-kinase n=1 Tax=Brevibacillus choshinensis TaxID=54911 RepID=A0ABX7FRJ8_BRECH|nr:PfkB family carbohydrate kinase [Brevibacillus choshinensis]QRG68869.1 fructoselysine 6-kinase [Brevibacillus choshinensis]